MKNQSPFFSVIIPTHEMSGKGHIHLNFLLRKLNEQTFKDFHVLVSDHSRDNKISLVCEKWEKTIELEYIKKEKNRDSPSSNLNSLISKSIGNYIKIFFLDDFPKTKDCLEQFYRIASSGIHKWIVCGSDHSKDGTTFYNPIIPFYNDKIYLGKNTISSPSVLCIQNKDIIPYDEEFKWLLDVVHYKEYYEKYGNPFIIKEILVTNGEGPDRLHYHIKNDEKFKEQLLSVKKFNQGFLFCKTSLILKIKNAIFKVINRPIY